MNAPISYSLKFLFRKSYRSCDNVEKLCRVGQATDDNWHICISCWVPKSTNTYSEYLILIAFPLQLWVYERAFMLRATYSACLVKTRILLQKS